MAENEKKKFPTWAIVLLVILGLMIVACPLISIVAAIAIPSLLRSRIAANESMAVATLRSVMSVEAAWRMNDYDSNAAQDYWTADLSGLYRVDQGSGRTANMIDPAMAAADDAKLAQGSAVPGRPAKDGKSQGAGLVAMPLTEPRAGYVYRAMKLDEQGHPFAADADGDGNAWTNENRFGFQARPAIYDSTGLNTFIVGQDGIIYGFDFGNARPENAEEWPGQNPQAQGWRMVQ